MNTRFWYKHAYNQSGKAWNAQEQVTSLDNTFFRKKNNIHSAFLISLSIIILLFFLPACTHTLKPRNDGPPAFAFNTIDIQQHEQTITPKAEPLSDYGNPISYIVDGKIYHILNTTRGYKERGIASWYGTKFHGERTSSGSPYNMFAMTAAHKSLPIPTYVKVKNLRNGKEVIVHVNDRGPFVDGRLIDLSYAAATKLGIVKNGTAPVEITALAPYQNIQDFNSNNQIPKRQRFLQIGVFQNYQNAVSQMNNIKQLALKTDVSINQENEPTGMIYKVQLGPLRQATNVRQIISKLNEIGIHQAWTVIR